MSLKSESENAHMVVLLACKDHVQWRRSHCSIPSLGAIESSVSTLAAGWTPLLLRALPLHSQIYWLLTLCTFSLTHLETTIMHIVSVQFTCVDRICEPISRVCAGQGARGRGTGEGGDGARHALTSPWQELRAAVPILVPCFRTVPWRWQGGAEEATILTWDRFPYLLSTM